MTELNILYSSSETDEDLFTRMDANRDGEVDFEDVRIIHTYPNKVEQWMASIPLGQLVASALLRLIDIAAKPTNFSSEEDSLRNICMISDQDLSLLFEGIKDAFLELMKSSINDLKLSFEKMDKVDGQKSTSEVLSCGDVSDFYNGIGDRVGNPERFFFELSCGLIRAFARMSKSKVLRCYAARAFQ
jgi:hypothetical protein